jgi:multidrug efflux system membrane fusion protein
MALIYTEKSMKLPPRSGAGRRLSGMLVLLVLVSGCRAGNADVEAGPPPAPEVSVAEVAVSDWHASQQFTGRLQAKDTVALRPRVGGYVEAVLFEEGSRVEAGTALFQIDPRPYRAEVARLTAERARARAELALARSNEARAVKLLAENAISTEEHDNLATAQSIAEASLGAVQAALDTAELNLEFTTVRAPIAGRLSRALITEGNLVDSSTLLTTLVSDDPIHAYFDADEQSYLDYVRGRTELGDAGTERPSVRVGLINEEGYPHEGALDFIDNQVNPVSGTIRGRAVLDNADGAFTPGLFVRLQLVNPESREVALVDDRAIGTDLDRKFVLIVDEENVAQYRQVETGPLVDDLRVILSGLQQGETVIVNGLQRVRPGMPVAPARVAMNRDDRQAIATAAAGNQ